MVGKNEIINLLMEMMKFSVENGYLITINENSENTTVEILENKIVIEFNKNNENNLEYLLNMNLEYLKNKKTT